MVINYIIGDKMLTCANKFIITFAQKGLTLLHLTVLISVVYLSYNVHLSVLMHSSNERDKGSSYPSNVVRL